ncbi:DUF6089 family protein [Rurimicrobium arvi]|uniref:DUF6089 domain-containing protein n=1 Tax=Rurimicrobium arvi TaxID=2049916 RepID=A0ABP8MLS6_9BACT
MLKKWFVICLLLIGAENVAQAQYFYRWTELGVSGGATQYFGDLNDNYGFHNIRENVGVFCRYNLNHYLALRFSANYARVGYDDKYNKNPYQNERNLNFQSNIFDATVQAEFNFFRFETGNLDNEWTPYITGGIGGFYYDPYTIFNGDKYYLRGIGTEGQNLPAYADRKYTNFALCFPIGVGVKWWLLPGVNMGLEITDRLTTTDYLDDVSTTYVGANNFASDPSVINPTYYIQDRSLLKNPSDPLGRAGKQRGNSATKDQYVMLQLHLSVQLRTYKCPVTPPYWRTHY